MPVPVDRWAQLAMERPWRYAATWAIGIGAANLGLRTLLNDLSLARNTRLAALTALGFLLFAWAYTAQLTRPLRRRRPATHQAAPTTGAAPSRSRRCQCDPPALSVSTAPVERGMRSRGSLALPGGRRDR